MAVSVGTLPDKVNKRFPYEMNWGFTGGPSFFTAIATGSSGFEQRNINWEVARHRYQASHQIKTQVEMDELRNFFMMVRGMGTGFRFLDWADYSTDMANQIGTTPLFTLATAGVLTPQDMAAVDSGSIGVGDGVETEFQTMKTYTEEPVVGDLNLAATQTVSFVDAGAGDDYISRSAGSWITDGFVIGDYVYVYGAVDNGPGYIGQITAVTALNLTFATGVLTAEAAVTGLRVLSQENLVTPYYREIKALIDVRPFVDDVEDSDFSVDLDTGLVTFDTAPADNATVTCDAIFDVWVRLASDDFMAELVNFNVGDWANIELIEIRE